MRITRTHANSEWDPEKHVSKSPPRVPVRAPIPPEVAVELGITPTERDIAHGQALERLASPTTKPKVEEAHIVQLAPTTTKSPAGVQPLSLRGAMELATMRVAFDRDSSAATLEKRALRYLPVLHDIQMEAELCGAKRVIINAGRRGGKTTAAADKAIKMALQGRRVLLASTTQDQADAFWEKCKTWLATFILAGEIEKNETRRTLVFHGTNGRIRVKTASDADMLRGDYADFLVLDECALLAPNAWYEVGAPMLLDNDGEAWFISTPRRRNWFYTLYQQAIADETGRWRAFSFTSFQNPYLSEEALAEITKDLTEEAFRQEIMAEFLEGEGAVFRNISACLDAPMPADPEKHKGHYVVMGVDWAQRNDYTVLDIFCATCREELAMERFNKIEFALQRDRLVNARNLWHVVDILAEENAIGVPIIEDLHNYDGIDVIPFPTTPTSKGPLVRGLALCFEKKLAKWLNIPVATSELEAYEATVSRITGHVQYSGPEGINDDTVMGRCLAWKQACDGPSISAPATISYRDMASSAPIQQGADQSLYLPYDINSLHARGLRLPGVNNGYNPYNN